MLKKTITYTDYDGNERTEDFYFNLTKAEAMEMELSINGGFSAMLNKIVSDRDVPKLACVFKDLILNSYGEKSPDGKYFLKRDKDGRRLSDTFAETEAFSQLYMDIITDAGDTGVAFINGVLPKMPEDHKAPQTTV